LTPLICFRRCISLLLAHQLSRLPLKNYTISITGSDISSSAIELSQQNQEELLSTSSSNPQVSLQYQKADLFSAKDMQNLINSASTLSTSALQSGDTRTQDEPQDHGFDLIICNPPYIPESDYQQLAKSVSNWEDRTALVGSHSSSVDSAESSGGLDFYRRLVELVSSERAGALNLLRENSSERRKVGIERSSSLALPALVLEVGKGQAEEVARMFEEVPEAGAVKLGNKAARKRFRCEIWKDSWGIDRVVLVWRN